MAQRVQVLLVCDLHDDDTEGTETVRFALDGASYEIDVCSEHAAQLRDSFASYVGAARRTGRVAASGGGRRQRVSSGVDPAAVRAWAKSTGVKVSERGRIPADVIEQYTAAGH
ncbi:MAG TPA: Lsr2 family protein [Mycobacteriales bacterium]|nr:Lsr2 family protein [Mycobacteriales bacterium]